jgi:hypothetical protein
MSEERGNSIKRWYKAWPTILYLSFLLCIIALIIVFSAGQLPEEGESPWFGLSDDIGNSVAYYQSTHNGSLPIFNGTYTNANCSECSVVNISALIVTNGGLLREAPNGLNLSPSGKDNCGGNTSLGCSSANSYIWIVNNDGVVFSYCAGAGCTTNNTGYQDVWP